MIKVEHDGFYLLFKQEDKEVLAGYEGGGSVLDLTAFFNLKVIERKAFLSAKSIRKVILPAKITRIGEWAFAKCSNLQSVAINAPFQKNIFSKGTFEGCDALTSIAFADTDKGLDRLCALNANRLANDHLLCSEDLGRESWYKKWDIYLIASLKADNMQMLSAYATGGEEDLPFEGNQMIDGEMPEDGIDVFKGIEKNKCLLAFLRLKYDQYLEEETKAFLREYIVERGFGKKHAYAWDTLREECGNDQEFYKLYLEIQKPDKEMIGRMVDDLNATQVQAKAFLIGEAANEQEQDPFAELLL